MSAEFIEQNLENIAETRAANLRDVAMSVDMLTDPRLSHLRPHQFEAVGAGLSYAATITGEELLQSSGACILSPPGSGKTIDGAALLTSLTSADYTPRALYLAPRTLIKEDALIRFEEFAPELDTFFYSPKKKAQGSVCLMMYQGLSGAIESGFIEDFQPDIIIGDEVHHVIDGEWAQLFKQLAVGRLVLGMTATPAYSHTKTIRELFPTVLAHKTFQEGVNEGFVSPFRSFMYGSHMDNSGDMQGMVRDMFDMLTIASRYAELGKVGIIACSPGDDTAHARALERLASNFKYGPDNVPLEIPSINGTMHPGEIRDILDALRAKRINAVAYTSMLGEGVDLPMLDYLGILGGTKSVVKATQRLGRGTRLGLVTDVHEFHRPGYVSHLDAFNDSYNPKSFDNRGSRGVQSRGSGAFFNHEITYTGPDFTRLMHESQSVTSEEAPTPLQETIIGNPGERSGYDWHTLERIAALTLQPLEIVEQFLRSQGFEPVRIELHGYKREHYSPEAFQSFIDSLDLSKFDDDHDVTLHAAYSTFKKKYGSGSLASYLQKLEEQGIKPVLKLDKNGSLVQTLDPSSSTLVSQAPERAKRSVSRLSSRRGARQRPVTPETARKTIAETLAEETPETKVENFLIFVASNNPNASLTEEDKKRRALRVLQTELRTVTSLSADELTFYQTKLNGFSEHSMAARNLVSMGTRHGLKPEQVLAAIMRTMNNL